MIKETEVLTKVKEEPVEEEEDEIMSNHSTVEFHSGLTPERSGAASSDCRKRRSDSFDAESGNGTKKRKSSSSESEGLVCKICPTERRFLHRKNLTQHYRRVHNNSFSANMIRCQCYKNFSFSSLTMPQNKIVYVLGTFLKVCITLAD